MALIKCPSCGKEISDQAKSCPQCGHPISAVTVELTSKKWKKYKLNAIGAFCIGLFLVILGPSTSPAFSVIGGLLLVTGVILGIIGRFGAWWNNA